MYDQNSDDVDAHEDGESLLLSDDVSSWVLLVIMMLRLFRVVVGVTVSYSVLQLMHPHISLLSFSQIPKDLESRTLESFIRSHHHHHLKTQKRTISFDSMLEVYPEFLSLFYINCWTHTTMRIKKEVNDGEGWEVRDGMRWGGYGMGSNNST